jgi:hydroxymethylpyrimidine/phosphomethylpyrimidine kinase
VKVPLCVLSIAGSDSGGGAGIQADQRTVRAIGGHALTAVTAVTAQDTRRVRAWKPVPDSLIAAQVSCALRGYDVDAVKTGLLPGPGAIRAVARALRAHPLLPLVVDPVISSTSGTRFLTREGVRVLARELFPRASVVTPNWPEAAALSGLSVSSRAQARRAACSLAERFGVPVLVKGGHSPGGACRDCLGMPGGVTIWFETPRLSTRNTHGTGCVLSTAIAAWLGRGADLVTAVRLAESFLHRALLRGRSLDWGGGRGPAFYGTR